MRVGFNMKLGTMLFACLSAFVTPALSDELPLADAGRIERHIQALAQFGANPEGGVSRVAFSAADLAGRDYIKGLMRDAGLAIRVDAAGNVIGRLEGTDSTLPVIILGSHIDSVPEGGNYDGDVGVIGAIEAAILLRENGVATRHPLEIVSFTDEEGGTVGSKAMAGKVGADALGLMSHSGLTVGDGIRAVGGDPARLDTARRGRDDIAAYLELHIEQGAILDETGVDIGVVEGIVGIRWWDVTIEGVANHAGTTPMNRRRDALVTAAELTLAVNRVATSTPGTQVATVGQIRAEPGAPNVIPGRVVMSLEIRDLAEAKMESVFRAIDAEARRIAQARATSISFAEVDMALVPAPTDARLRKIIAQSASDLNLSHRVMPSGAGHDAQEIANIAPIGMIFVPSKDGISHAPQEFTSREDMANGVNVLLRTLLAIDRVGLD